MRQIHRGDETGNRAGLRGRAILPRGCFLLALLIIASTAYAVEHAPQFEFTESFVLSWAHHPVADIAVKFDCPSNEHLLDADCEIHLGAELSDPSVSDFQGLVLEPPNVCKDAGVNWKTVLAPLHNEDCTAYGFWRAWPEHLTSGSGCSNPDHILEIHPMLKLTCTSATHDFTSKLRGDTGIPYKPLTTVRKMQGMRLWISRGSAAEGISAIRFDYCFPSATSCTRGTASNFARFKVRILRNTIRPAAGDNRGFLTVIARVRAVSTNDVAETQAKFLKLYALDGSEFYTTLDNQRNNTGSVPTWDIIGIFAIDPYSVLKVLDRPGFTNDTWTAVDFPVSVVVFGTK